jgi:hypothetical protein
MRLIALIFGLIALTSCATISEEECRAGNWGEIGFADGKAGRAAPFLANHAKACAEVGIVPDKASWEAGRIEGLTLYCTADNAYALGRSGREMNEVCPVSVTRMLSRANDWGLEYYKLSAELEELKDERSTLRDLLSGLEGPDLTEEEKELRRQYRSRLARVEDEIFDLQFDLRRYERLPATL